MAVFGPRQITQRLLNIEEVRQIGSASEGKALELEIVLQSSKMLTPDTAFTHSFSLDEVPTRKGVFGGYRKTFILRWSPHLGEITAEDSEGDVIEMPVSVLLSYREGERLIRTNKAVNDGIKLDTTRLRRRLYSKLDFLMGKVPGEFKG